MPVHIPSPSKPKPERVWTAYVHVESEEEKKKNRIWKQLELEWLDLKTSGKTEEADALSKNMFERMKELMNA